MPPPTRVTAASILLDRAWGNPKEHLQLDDKEKVSKITFVIEPGEQVTQAAEPKRELPLITIDTVPFGSGDD